MNWLLLVTTGVMCSCGTYLLMSRHLSRVIIGVGLLGHGVNLFLIMSGTDGGEPAFVGVDPPAMADPMPQALVLTAIVISFAVIAFLLAMAFRSWSQTGDDLVEERPLGGDADPVASAASAATATGPAGDGGGL